MIAQLKKASKVVGVKQSCRAIAAGRAACVFVAEDADPKLVEPLRGLAAEQQVPVESVPHMKALGDACGISVGAAVAVLLK